MNIIEINNLFLHFNNEKNEMLYSNLSLTIKKGKLIAIIGKSGSGKTTLFRVITRNLIPSSGSVKIFDKNIYDTGKKEWNNKIKKIGILTQKTNLIYSKNVFENVKNGVINYHNFFYSLFMMITKTQKIKIFEILDQLGILDKSFFLVSSLSGGQQQRVEIAKLLIKNVDLILADEPTSNLDYHTSLEVIDLLVKLNKEFGKTVLVNIHDLNLAIEKFDEVVVLKEGRIILHDEVKNLKLWKLKEML